MDVLDDGLKDEVVRRDLAVAAAAFKAVITLPAGAFAAAGAVAGCDALDERCAGSVLRSGCKALGTAADVRVATCSAVLWFLGALSATAVVEAEE